jgi:hypothetical protein
MKPPIVSTINQRPQHLKEQPMKIFGMDFGPAGRPTEQDLKSVVAESDARLGQSSTLVYSPNDTGEVSLDDLAKGSTLDTPQAPDNGFTPRPVLGGTKSPW